MTTPHPSVLLIGYGNPGRLDDGLGPALAARVEKLAPAGVKVDSDYQLMVEDAAEAARHDVVVFADASVNGREPFSFAEVAPVEVGSFSTHSLEPEAVLGLARDMFGGKTRGYALGIRGYRFNEFGEGLSEEARRNLEQALGFLLGVIGNGLFEEAAAAYAADAGARDADGDKR